ncbi:hypothetical protein FISHEDRAFT_71039 [Fistulina hepatica ATCC 64428]|uniref:Uncharacterized protein n=1 Tax=Fistulina hepatica ATCC 64428 TaxID=1128425 RepID=A0A0D7AHC7_9AGAR|nr:hypothetical protein FISHEDRAFT_71039 [Fistulina hepatica ATCC 64428]
MGIAGVVPFGLIDNTTGDKDMDHVVDNAIEAMDDALEVYAQWIALTREQAHDLPIPKKGLRGDEEGISVDHAVGGGVYTFGRETDIHTLGTCRYERHQNQVGRRRDEKSGWLWCKDALGGHRFDGKVITRDAGDTHAVTTKLSTRICIVHSWVPWSPGE